MSEQRTPDEIREEIDQTREELADTAAALAHKTDVKARAQHRVDEVKANVTDRVDEAKANVTGKVDEAKAKVSDAAPPSAGGAAQSVQSTVRSNPVPAAAIAAAVLGFALGYLISRRR